MKPSVRPLDKSLLGPALANPVAANAVRRRLPTVPTHFNRLPGNTLVQLLIRMDAGPTDDDVRQLFTYLAELGIVTFENDLVCATPLV